MHVLGQFKAGEKPNRAELENILKAGGASLVDAAEPWVDLAIMHRSTPHDNPKVTAESLTYYNLVSISITLIGRITSHLPETNLNIMAHGSR